MRRVLLILVAASALGGCATNYAQRIETGTLQPAAAPPPPVAPTPKAPPRAAPARPPREAAPLDALAAANLAARQRPTRDTFDAARQIYAFRPGALFELYTHPNYVSTVLLEPGETLLNIAAGDTSRWMVTEAETEAESGGRTVVLVKPQTAGLKTNIVLITDRRTYLIEAMSQLGAAYAAQVAWTYPPRGPARDVSAAPAADRFHYDYRIRTVRGRAPVWAPTRVFDDGRRTWIEFSTRVGAADLPPLFLITPEGAAIANYRVDGRRYMLDRLIDRAELRLGDRHPVVVRIERRGGRP